jgi:hypothetical protein
MLTTTPERTHYRALVAEIAAKAQAKLPECNGRVAKAVALVLQGDVEGLNDDGSWRVGSCTDPLTTHRVSGTSCSCDDSQYGRAPRGLCKHVLAVMIQMRVQELLPPAQSTPVETGAPVAELPEARSSANVRLQVCGREVLITLRDHDEAALMVRLEELIQRYGQAPAPPAAAVSPQSSPPQGQQMSPAQHNAMAQQQAVTGWCKMHGVALHWDEGKDGRKGWFSHRTDAGWCKGR